ncbi:MAG TPA: hypothetical protein VFW68_05380 [Rhodocyclaceae bacterium]|nr:hypothetical protein [Rhodocyclaceae bacterium]
MDIDSGSTMFDEEHRVIMALIEELHPEAGELHTEIWFELWRQRILFAMDKQFHREEVRMVETGVPVSLLLTHAEDHKRLLFYMEHCGRAQASKSDSKADDVYQTLKSEFLKHFLMFDSVAKKCTRLNDKLADAMAAVQPVA